MFADKKLNKYFNENDESKFIQRLLTNKNTNLISSPVIDDCREYALETISNLLDKRNGKVYIANNLNHIHLLKIGRTFKDIKDRERSLNSAGVIGSVKILYWVDTVDCVHTEMLVHKKLKSRNIEKEFYSIDCNHAIEVITECSNITRDFYAELMNKISSC